MFGVDFSAAKPPGRLLSHIKVRPFAPNAATAALPGLNVHIDDTGDRGPGAKNHASPIFGMAVVVIGPGAEPAVRAVLSQMRRDFATPVSRPLSWKKTSTLHVVAQAGGAVPHPPVPQRR